jgi:hypothetical protein
MALMVKVEKPLCNGPKSQGSDCQIVLQQAPSVARSPAEFDDREPASAELAGADN